MDIDSFNDIELTWQRQKVCLSIDQQFLMLRKADDKQNVINQIPLDELLIAVVNDNSTVKGIKNVISVCIRRSLVPEEDTANDGSCVRLYCIDRRKNCQWALSSTLLTCLDGAQCTAQLMADTINLNLKRLHRRPANLLVFINPFGGKKRANKIYQKWVQPIFNLCKIKRTEIVTERADHAKDYLLNEDLTCFDGVVIVGGDGLLNEAIYALVVRAQSNGTVDDPDVRLESPKLILGTIPAGSTNVVNHTIHGNGDPLTSALHIAQGDVIKIDTCGIYSCAKLQHFACSAVSFGFLGDMLRYSEQLRRFGPIRYLMAGAKQIFQNNSYSGLVEYNGKCVAKDRHGIPPCESGCSFCKDATENIDDSSITDYGRVQSNWTHVVGVVTPCLSDLSPDGMSPTSHLSDGKLDLMLVPRVGVTQNMKLFGRIWKKGMDHTISSRVEIFRVSEFTYTPSVGVDETAVSSLASAPHSPISTLCPESVIQTPVINDRDIVDEEKCHNDSHNLQTFGQSISPGGDNHVALDNWEGGSGGASGMNFHLGRGDCLEMGIVSNSGGQVPGEFDNGHSSAVNSSSKQHSNYLAQPEEEEEFGSDSFSAAAKLPNYSKNGSLNSSDIPVSERDYGVWNVDGEIFIQGPETVTVRSHHRLIKMYGRGIERCAT